MKLNQSFLQGSGHLTEDYCRKRKKLILACDMDETLLTESERSSRVFMRPKIMYLLRTLRITYELCLITYSTRARAEQILKLKLDPNGKLFNGRVLCREDVTGSFNNKQEALYAHLPPSNCISESNQKNQRPLAWQYIVILDDDPGTWSHCPTCIPIRPFTIRPVSLKNKSSISSHEGPSGEGGYVLSMQRFLCKLHAAVFKCKVFSLVSSTGTTPGTNIYATDSEYRKKKRGTSTSPESSSSALDVIETVKRRINSDARFKSLCYLDPGKLLNVESSRKVITNEQRFQSKFDNGFTISFIENGTVLT